MPGTRAIRSAFSAAACAALLAACGDDEAGTIPADAGEALLTQLDAVEQRVGEGDCEGAADAAVALAQGVSDLPPTVDGELRQRLVEASVNLEGLTQDPSECEPAGATGETGLVPEPETTTETTTTPEPPTEERPETGDDEEEAPQPPSQGGGGDGGGGGGQGSGGDGSGGIGSGDD